MVKKPPVYTYNARLLRVIDGDTIEAELDLGFKIYKKLILRLARIDCAETRGQSKKLGFKARDFVCEHLPQNFVVYSRLFDSFGRAIAEIYFKEEVTGNWVLLNDLLVGKELAVYRKF